VFDTRAADAAKELGGRIDPVAQHARTGCVLHPSYLPAKLLWLSKSKPDAFPVRRRAGCPSRISFSETVWQCGPLPRRWSPVRPVNQNLNDYDAEMLDALPVDRAQLCPADRDGPAETNSSTNPAGLGRQFDASPGFRRWAMAPATTSAAACITPSRFALMSDQRGHAGGVRVRIDTNPSGLFCYRADRKRFVLGGALSNGGEVFAWMKQRLTLPPDDQIESQLASMEPGAHG